MKYILGDLFFNDRIILKTENEIYRGVFCFLFNDSNHYKKLKMKYIGGICFFFFLMIRIIKKMEMKYIGVICFL